MVKLSILISKIWIPFVTSSPLGPTSELGLSKKITSIPAEARWIQKRETCHVGCTHSLQHWCSISLHTSISNYKNTFIEGNFEVKLPTIWRDGRAKVGRVRKGEKKSVKKKKWGCAKGRKVAIYCVFQWLVAPEGRFLFPLVWPSMLWGPNITEKVKSK